MNRYEDAFNALVDCSVGTLWRVREDLLKERVPGYDQSSDRKCHPGLSVRKKPVPGQERIPLLVGVTSPGGGPIRVRDVFHAGGADYVTHFGNTLAPLRMRDFTEFAPDYDRDQLVGDGLDLKRVTVNWHKPRLDTHEHAVLERWMQQRGMTDE